MGMTGFVDPGRAVLSMAGADARDVLQNVVTNDLDLLTPGRAIYAALLTPQGKYLFDFFLLDGATFGHDGAVLVDVAADRAAALAMRLKMYCLRRDARVGAAPGLPVALVWGAGPAPARGIPDPRAEILGWRVYGGLPDGVGAATRDDYDALRVSAAVPETGVELIPEQTFILEAGFERLSGVDFRKGCYVGQEVTARMKHKARLRKGLVRVRLTGAAEAGTEILAGGKSAGTLFTASNGLALAHLRLDRAGEGMTAGAAVVDYPAETG